MILVMIITIGLLVAVYKKYAIAYKYRSWIKGKSGQYASGRLQFLNVNIVAYIMFGFGLFYFLGFFLPAYLRYILIMGNDPLPWWTFGMPIIPEYVFFWYSVVNWAVAFAFAALIENINDDREITNRQNLIQESTPEAQADIEIIEKSKDYIKREYKEREKAARERAKREKKSMNKNDS